MPRHFTSTTLATCALGIGFRPLLDRAIANPRLMWPLMLPLALPLVWNDYEEDIWKEPGYMAYLAGVFFASVHHAPRVLEPIASIEAVRVVYESKWLGVLEVYEPFRFLWPRRLIDYMVEEAPWESWWI